MTGQCPVATTRFEELLAELRYEYERLALSLRGRPMQDADRTMGGPRAAALAASLSPSASAQDEPDLEIIEMDGVPGQVTYSCSGVGLERGSLRWCPSAEAPIQCSADSQPVPGSCTVEHQPAIAKVLEGTSSVDTGWLSRASGARKSVAEIFSSSSDVFFDEPARQPQKAWSNRLREVASSPSFELFWSVVILMSTLMMAAEAQYDGMQAAWAHPLTEPRPVEPASERWPDASSVFLAASWFFGVVFMIELSIRVVALRMKFFLDPFGWIDFFAVVIWVFERAFAAITLVDARVIRIARLVKLMRFLRIIKFMNAFDKLYLMLASIRSSFSALTWSAAVLLLVEVVVSLLLNLLLEGFWKSADNPLEHRQEIYRYFGTFTKALLSMFEMLLGNWYTITRELVKVSEWYAIVGIIHQLIMGFAVIEVITGVFLHETFKVASLDDGIMTNEMRRAIRNHTAKMKVFFQFSDRDGNGLLDHDELEQVFQQQKVQEWLSAMGLDVKDVSMAFSVFDENNDGMISAEEFVTGSMRLKGPARAIDLAVLQANLAAVMRKLEIESHK